MPGDSCQILTTKESWNPTWPEAHLVTTKQTKSGWWLPMCKKPNIPFGSFQWYYWSKSPKIWLDKKHNWQHPIKFGSLKCYIALMTNAVQKKKKNYYPGILQCLEEFSWPHQHLTKNGSLRYPLPLNQKI